MASSIIVPGATALSEVTPRDYSQVPEELKLLRQWCVFRLVSNSETPGKFEKQPFQSLRPNVGCASTRPEEWSSFEQAVACAETPKNNVQCIGFALTPPYIGTDLDDCFKDNGLPKDYTYDYVNDLDSYTERSPSGRGLHIINRGKLPANANPKGGVAEVYQTVRFFTVTGKSFGGLRPIREMSDSEAVEHYHKVKRGNSPTVEVIEKRQTKLDHLLNGDMKAAKFDDPSAAVQSLLTLLAQKHRGDKETIEAEFLASRLYLETCAHWQKKWPRLRESELAKAIEFAQKHPGAVEIDADSWRDGSKPLDEFSTKPRIGLLGPLVYEHSMTAVVAPSYHLKSQYTLCMVDAMSKGEGLWGFNPPDKPVPWIYNVPEMDEALVRDYITFTGMKSSELFLVRAMESQLWTLDDPRMLRSAEKGYGQILDTAGYFNPAENGSDYQQALQFSKLVYRLLNVGAPAVIALFHISKAAENQAWSLSNSVIGSTAYGGMLRSVQRLQNLNPDLNDPHSWLYVEGMKNPGLKPFQLEGPPPLKMKVAPGDSPYLRDLLKELDASSVDPKKAKAFAGFDAGTSSRELIEQLHIGGNTLSKWRAEWQAKQTDDETESQELEGGLWK